MTITKKKQTHRCRNKLGLTSRESVVRKGGLGMGLKWYRLLCAKIYKDILYNIGNMVNILQ